MIRDIQLYGNLAETYGYKTMSKDVDTTFDLVAALKSELKDFRSYLNEYPDQMVILTDKDRKNPRSIQQSFNGNEFGDAAEIHIIPNHNGAGIEVAVSVFGMTNALGIFVVNTIANMLISMALGSLAQALAPSPETQASEHDVQQQPSFLYNGTQNVTEQGFPVPVIYGIHMTGSIVVGAGISLEQLLVTPSQSAPPSNGGGGTQPSSPPAMSWQWGGGV